MSYQSQKPSKDPYRVNPDKEYHWRKAHRGAAIVQIAALLAIVFILAYWFIEWSK